MLCVCLVRGIDVLLSGPCSHMVRAALLPSAQGGFFSEPNYPLDPAKGDYWQYAVMRDHVNKQYWFRTPSAPRWKLIDVAKLAAAPQKPYTGTYIPGEYAADQSWFQDVSDLANSPLTPTSAPTPATVRAECNLAIGCCLR